MARLNDKEVLLMAINGGGGLTEEEVNTLIEKKGYQNEHQVTQKVYSVFEGKQIQENIESMITSKGYQTREGVFNIVYAENSKLEERINILEENGGGGGLTEEELVNLGFVKDTDYATKDKGGVFKVSNDYGTRIISGSLAGLTRTVEQYQSLINHFFISKGTLDAIKEYYVKSGLIDNALNSTELTEEEKTDISAWLGTVKTTDFATKDTEKAGIIKLRAHGDGGLTLDGNGFLSTQAPSLALMKQRNSIRPLVSSSIEELMKVGIAGIKSKWNGSVHVDTYGNQIPLSDEEKASAQAWLGIESGGSGGTWYENKEAFVSQIEPTLVSQTLLSNPKKVKVVGSNLSVEIINTKTEENLGVQFINDIMYPTVQEVVSTKSGSTEHFGFSFYGKARVDGKTIENIPVTVVCYLTEGVDIDAGQGDGTTRIILASYHINWTDGSYIVKDYYTASSSCEVSLLF